MGKGGGEIPSPKKTIMESLLLQLGVGGIFAVLVIKLVLDFLSKKNGKTNGAAGERPVEYWQQQNREIFESVMEKTLTKQLDELLRLLREVRDEVRDGQVMAHHRRG